jgi:hypothetical protein
MIRQRGGARQGGGGGRAMRARGEKAMQKGGRGARRQGGVARGGGGGRVRPIPTARTRSGHGEPNASVRGDGGGPTKTQQPVKRHGSDLNATAANRSQGQRTPRRKFERNRGK